MMDWCYLNICLACMGVKSMQLVYRPTTARHSNAHPIWYDLGLGCTRTVFVKLRSPLSFRTRRNDVWTDDVATSNAVNEAASS